jgi:hypothetical protein
MAFDPHREEGVTLGAGGNLGRGHYSSSCAQEMHRERFASGAVSAEYTFARDSVSEWWPQVTLGGKTGAVFFETQLVATREDNSDWMPMSASPREQWSSVAEGQLQLDWTYVGLQGGAVMIYPKQDIENRFRTVFPSGELRIGSLESFFVTASLGGGFAVPVAYPFEVAYGLGWQGSDFGAWMGITGQYYHGSEIRLLMNYRLHPVTLLGSFGVLTDDDGSFPGHYGRGEPIRLAMGMRWHL